MCFSSIMPGKPSGAQRPKPGGKSQVERATTMSQGLNLPVAKGPPGSRVDEGSGDKQPPTPLAPHCRKLPRRSMSWLSLVRKKKINLSIYPFLLGYTVVLEISPTAFITETLWLYHLSNPKGPKKVGNTLKEKKASNTFTAVVSVPWDWPSTGRGEHHFPAYLPLSPWAAITVPGTSISFKPPGPKSAFSAHPGPEFLLFDPATERGRRICFNCLGVLAQLWML